MNETPNGTIVNAAGTSNSETGSNSMNTRNLEIISFFKSITLVSEISPEQEFFLHELETTDSGSIGLILR
jgi:hypothetical protein